MFVSPRFSVLRSVSREMIELLIFTDCELHLSHFRFNWGVFSDTIKTSEVQLVNLYLRVCHLYTSVVYV